MCYFIIFWNVEEWVVQIGTDNLHSMIVSIISLVREWKLIQLSLAAYPKVIVQILFFPHFRAYGWHNGLFAKPRLVLSSRLMTLSWFQLLFSTLENTKQHHHESVHPAVMGHGRWAPADWLSAPDGPSMMKRVLISGQTSLKQSTHRRFSLGFMLNS